MYKAGHKSEKQTLGEERTLLNAQPWPAAECQALLRPVTSVTHVNGFSVNQVMFNVLEALERDENVPMSVLHTYVCQESVGLKSAENPVTFMHETFLTLETYLWFVWHSNLTGCSVFLFAKSGHCRREVGIESRLALSLPTELIPPGWETTVFKSNKYMCSNNLEAPFQTRRCFLVHLPWDSPPSPILQVGGGRKHCYAFGVAMKMRVRPGLKISLDHLLAVWPCLGLYFPSVKLAYYCEFTWHAA